MNIHGFRPGSLRPCSSHQLNKGFRRTNATSISSTLRLTTKDDAFTKIKTQQESQKPQRFTGYTTFITSTNSISPQNLLSILLLNFNLHLLIPFTMANISEWMFCRLTNLITALNDCSRNSNFCSNTFVLGYTNWELN